MDPVDNCVRCGELIYEFDSHKEDEKGAFCLACFCELAGITEEEAQKTV